MLHSRNRKMSHSSSIVGPSRIVTLIGPLPPPFGGVSIHLFRLLHNLRNTGWDAHVLRSGAAGGPRPRLGNSIPAHLVRVGRHAQGIAHVHNRVSVLSAAALVSARARRRPTVFTLHGMPFNPLTSRTGFDAFMRVALRLADRVVYVNPELQALGARWRGRRESCVIPAYLPPLPGEAEWASPDLKAWLDRTSGLPLVVLTVYRILSTVHDGADLYGLALTAEALARAVERTPPFRLAVMLAQPGKSDAENGYLAEVMQRFERLLGERVRSFVGDYAPAALCAAAVYLRPTLTDGDSVAVREALDLGVPVVASDCAPRPPGALLHRTGDPDDLAARVVEALSRGRTAPAAQHARHLGPLVDVYNSLC